MFVAPHTYSYTFQPSRPPSPQGPCYVVSGIKSLGQILSFVQVVPFQGRFLQIGSFLRRTEFILEEESVEILLQCSCTGGNIQNKNPVPAFLRLYSLAPSAPASSVGHPCLRKGPYLLPASLSPHGMQQPVFSFLGLSPWKQVFRIALYFFFMHCSRSRFLPYQPPAWDPEPFEKGRKVIKLEATLPFLSLSFLLGCRIDRRLGKQLTSEVFS